MARSRLMTKGTVLAVICLAVLAGLAFTPPGRGMLTRIYHAVACSSDVCVAN